jgi:preprotein translocase subunit SecE
VERTGADSGCGRFPAQKHPRERDDKEPPRGEGSGTERQMAAKTINPFSFLQQVRSETAKVTWPSRRETMISTMMVVVFAFIAAIFFFTADQLMGFAVEKILGLGQ